MKVCKTCGISKPLDEFHKHTKTRDGDCIECRRKKNRQWWLEHRSKDSRKCHWCGQPLGHSQRIFHPLCREQADEAQRNADKWQCAPGKCLFYARCVITVRLGARLPCQPENVEPIPVVGLEVISEFSGIRLR